MGLSSWRKLESLPGDELGSDLETGKDDTGTVMVPYVLSSWRNRMIGQLPLKTLYISFLGLP